MVRLVDLSSRLGGKAGAFPPINVFPVLIKWGSGNRGASQCESIHEATSGMSSLARPHPEVLPVPVSLGVVGARATPLLTIPQYPDSTQPPAATLSPHPSPSAGTSTSISSSRKEFRPPISLLGGSIQPQKGNQAVSVLCHLLAASLEEQRAS